MLLQSSITSDMHAVAWLQARLPRTGQPCPPSTKSTRLCLKACCLASGPEPERYSGRVKQQYLPFSSPFKPASWQVPTGINQHKHRQQSCVRASYTPFDYNEEEFFEVCTCSAPYGPVNQLSPTGCTLLFKQLDSEMSLNTEVLEVFIGGDTARNVSILANNQVSDRPLMHDLLWQILERGQEISKREWKILRVAIVGISEDAFVGRLFFGDAETNKVVWDCDCRPSDGFWLALKSGAPMLMSKQVWEVAGKKLKDTTTYQSQTIRHFRRQQASQYDGLRSSAATMAMGQVMPQPQPQSQPSDPQDAHTIKQNDLEAVKLLKRELQLAIKEEDYSKAVTLRDHPYMKMYMEIEDLKKSGKYEEAYDLQETLQKKIESAESQSGIIDK